MKEASYQSIQDNEKYSELSKKPENIKVPDLSYEPKKDNVFSSSQPLVTRRSPKSLQDLNMLDSFLFSASTEKIQDAEFIAKIIIERATGRKLDKVVVEEEKQLMGIDIDRRGVRLDLCISEIENERLARVYDIEPNSYAYSDLPKRDRYYQSMLDVKLLDRGTNFRDLPELISIWILPKDPFGCNQMIYTVKNVVVENNDLLYNDGVTKLFLYTEGKYGGSEKLKALLKYMTSTSATDAVDDELEKLHNVVDDVKHRREVGERYMSLQDWVEYEIETGIEEGINARMEAELKRVEAEVGKKVEAEIGKHLEAEKEQFQAEKEQFQAQKEQFQAEKKAMQAQLEAQRQSGIQALVRTCKSLGQDEAATKAILMKEYELSEEEADKFLK